MYSWPRVCGAVRGDNVERVPARADGTLDHAEKMEVLGDVRHGRRFELRLRLRDGAQVRVAPELQSMQDRGLQQFGLTPCKRKCRRHRASAQHTVVFANAVPPLPCPANGGAVNS